MTIRALKNRIRDKVWVFLKAKWQLRSGVAIVVENDSDWFVYNEIFCSKEYDEAIGLFLKNLPAAPLVVDLGANVGYFTLKIADELKIAGNNNFQVVALEASPFNFSILERRLNQQALRNQVKACKGMAGYRSGSQTISHSAQHYGHSSFADKQQSSNITTAHYVNIEDILPGNKRTVDFLKCDIEGSEEIFIKEYQDLLNRTSIAVFEWHANVVDVPLCRKMLQQAGLHSKGVLKEDPAFATMVEVFQRL